MSSTRNKLIDLLSSAEDSFISGQFLSDELQISRSAIWKHMNELKKDGYEIESKQRKGYRIISSPNKVSENTLTWGLQTEWLGKNIHHRKSIDSTQKLAHQYALDGAKHGTVVIADEQTAGRGRLGRNWDSRKDKGIWMSMILRPNILPYLAPQLTLLTATVIAQAIEEVTGIIPKIKWPNDILIEQRKVCGILTEMQAEQDKVLYVVIGFGLNVNQTIAELPVNESYQITSLANESDRQFDLRAIIQCIFNHFETSYEQYMKMGFMNIKETWENYGFKINERLTYTSGNIRKEALFLGIAEDGALQVKHDNGNIEKIYSAEIEWF